MFTRHCILHRDDGENRPSEWTQKRRIECTIIDKYVSSAYLSKNAVVYLKYFPLFNYSANIDRIPSTGVIRVDAGSVNWEKAWYDLEVQWEPTMFERDSNLTITILAYREDGSQVPRWEEVYTITDKTENDGSHRFEGEPVPSISEENAFGAIRIHEIGNP